MKNEERRKRKMKKKIVGICICALVIGATVLSVVGTEEKYIVKDVKNGFSTNKLNTIMVEHGVILAQDLDDQGRGYSVLRVWGSFYEMGYARAELLGDSIVQELNLVKAFFGAYYSYYKEIIGGGLYPTDVEDEINGMVDCLTLTHPGENISVLDVKMICDAWTCYIDFGCRSHTCWGRYVAQPIKTLSTRRIDISQTFPIPRHHVLCAHIPDDDSPWWVSLDTPGFVGTWSSINEYGTLVSCHAWFPFECNLSSGRMGMASIRHALTYATDPDVSTHLDTVYEELQHNESMLNGFVNYYAPEGYGGVMAVDPSMPGPDYFHLRRPNESWHHGEAMITTNMFTDGSTTPPDEDFGADDYYDNETSKTLESHWDLLADHPPAGLVNFHMMSVAYRDYREMTIWADGYIQGTTRTPRLEYEWSDLFEAENQQPAAPTISGPAKGKIKVDTMYNFTTTDPDGDEVSYYIEWGDGTNSNWIGPYLSGDVVTKSHTWSKKGTYIIKAKAIDIHGNESDWGQLSVTMPYSYNVPFLSFWEKLFEQFPNAFPLLRHLMGY